MSERDVLSLLEAGNKAQLEKLKENEHKKGFDDIELGYAFNRLSEERCELGTELYYERTGNMFFEFKFKDDLDYNKIRKEAADVANFAHMIVLECDKQLKK